MKTAMQELLDMLQIQNPLRGQMIEKEKQQIINAYDEGKYLSNDKNFNGETYYNNFNK